MNHLEDGSKRAGLVVITDESDDLESYCFILRYVSKKLNDLDLMLSKAFFITRHDYSDIRKQMSNLIGSSGDSNDHHSLSWLLVTTTNRRNDLILDQLRNDMFPKGGRRTVKNMLPNLVLCEENIFFVNNESFFASIASIVSYILLNEATSKRIVFLFDEKFQKDDFLKTLNTNNQSKDFKTSYAKHAIELNLTTPLSKLPIIEKFDYIFNNNYPNADHFVYNFVSLSRSFLESPSSDLAFLVNKIDLDNLGEKLAHSLSIIEKTLKTSHPQQTCISFNGGKDCCVVLYLFYACALRLASRLPLNVVIIKIQNSFSEMDEFLFGELKKFYRDSIQYIVLENASKTLKQSLFDLKCSRPYLTNILMGTRRTDAAYFKSMSEFAPTDADWPSFVRVNPILDWRYAEIWFFIRLLKLPYCELYNRGFTSIDCSQKTVPNPALFDPMQNCYLPAYFLEDENLERNSRVK